MRSVRQAVPLVLAFLLSGVLCVSQALGPDSDPKERIRLIRESAKKYGEGIPEIAAYIRDPDLSVRLEAAQRLADIGGPRTLSPLITLSADPDPEIQLIAVDGLVNIYVPGYLKNGVSRSVKRSDNGVKARFNEPADVVVEGYVKVAPEATAAISAVLRDSKNLDAKANAARAFGTLRTGSAVKDLTAVLYSKDDQLMYESLIALQKIRDASAGPSAAFLVRDLNPKVQLAALRTAGILRSKQAAPSIRTVLSDAGNSRLGKEAMDALGKIGDPADRDLFLRLLSEKDSTARASAAEGLGRIRNPADLDRLKQAFEDERDSVARLAEAFALVSLGQMEMNESSAFRYVLSALNRSNQRSSALAYLMELSRTPAVRQALYLALLRATKDEKMGACQALGESGENDSLQYLNVLKEDSDASVAQVCLNSLRTLETRLR